jgi:hypothetical protein
MDVTPVSDFILTCNVQNAHIIRVMEVKNIDPLKIGDVMTIEGLSRAFHEKYKDKPRRYLAKMDLQMRQLIGLKLVPKKPNGEWIDAARMLAELLDTPCETLWPARLDTVIPEQRKLKAECLIGQTASIRVM